MNNLIYNLIGAMREELKQYGGMLATLEQQQDFTACPEPGDLLLNVVNINRQAEAIVAARDERERCLGAVERGLGLEISAGFAEVIPLLPKHYRPLIEALEQENNQLAIRICYRARRNHLLLGSAAESMQQLIKAIFPDDGPETSPQLEWSPGKKQKHGGSGLAVLSLIAPSFSLAV